jgi:hypothetical protein
MPQAQAAAQVTVSREKMHPMTFAYYHLPSVASATHWNLIDWVEATTALITIKCRA